MPAARPELVAHAGHGERSTLSQLVEACLERPGDHARVVDALAHGHQLAGGAELRNDTRWDAEAGGDPLNPWRLGSRVAQACQQSVDPSPHLRVQDDRLVLWEPNPMPAPQKPA